MRIAVTYDNGTIFQHFGHTAQFKLYDVDNGVVESTQLIDASGSGHGALAGLLSGLQVDVLICGGIGAGAQSALKQAGISLYGGVSGNADDAVSAFLAGTLSYQPDIQCNHHHNHHSCGNHTCDTDKGGCTGN